MATSLERSYYTSEKMAIASRNLERHAWAREQRRQIIERADKWLQYDDARLRTLVPPPEIPRSYETHEKCAPINGDAILRYGERGQYSWIISFDDPWKIKSPVDGAVYPSNDFAAFMETGFKDRSLLTGPYPDDGWGCRVEGEPYRYWFVAYYAQWSVSRFLLPAIGDLSRAYLLTDDRRYAHACAVLLWQTAECYPRYFYETQSRTSIEFNAPYKGRLLDCVWETSVPRITAPAYDAIRAAIADDGALAALTGLSGAETCERIEDRLLRTMVNDIMDGSARIQGNYGLHQLALLDLAVVLRHSRKAPTSEEMIEFVLYNPDARNSTQLGMADAVNNLLHRDGYPSESPHYSRMWVGNMGLLAERLGAKVQDVLETQRFRRLFDWPLRITVANEFTPAHGDTGGMFHERLDCDHGMECGFRLYKAPALALALSREGAKLQHDLFLEPLDDDVKEAADKHDGPLDAQHQLLPGVGFARLRTGGPENCAGLALFYGYYWNHAHFDLLHLDLYAWRNALTPDFGYPERADLFGLRRFGFTANTVAHNTVVMDAHRQTTDQGRFNLSKTASSDEQRKLRGRGRLHLFDPGPFVQVVEVSAESAYSNRAKLYRRTLMLVEVGPEQAYVVDIFRVRGGRQHDWLVHGTQADFESDLPFSPPREQGTLAGPDVPYGFYYDDDRYREDKRDTRNYLYEGSGFQFLCNVQQAALDGVGTASWHLNRPANLKPDRPGKGVVLRAHLVAAHRNGGETLFACDGFPQRHDTWPKTVKFLVRRRQGEELESLFVTVFEPYKKTPFIRSVRALPVEMGNDLAVALEINCGRKTHVVFNRLDTDGAERPALTLPGNVVLHARAAVVERTSDGRLDRAYLLDDEGSRLAGRDENYPRALRAEVKTVDYEKGEVTLTQPILSETPAGGVAIVESERHANAIPVHEARSTETFSVGDDELSAGTVRVVAVKDNVITFNPKCVYYVEPGMTVVNEAGIVVGRVRSVEEGHALLETRRALTESDFPDLDRDGRRTCKFMVVGPGDKITLHASSRLEENAVSRET